MAPRMTVERQRNFYDRQSSVAKQRAIERFTVTMQVEALMNAGMTKSAAVASVASLGNASAASVWIWLAAVSGISCHVRLAYLVPRFKDCGRQSAIDFSLLEQLAADYLRPERPSRADCVRRGQAHAQRRGIPLPHARTPWRRLCKIYDRPTMALLRHEEAGYIQEWNK